MLSYLKHTKSVLLRQFPRVVVMVTWEGQYLRDSIRGGGGVVTDTESSTTKTHGT